MQVNTGPGLSNADADGAAARLHLLGADERERLAWAETQGLKPYRPGQLAEWLFEQGAADVATIPHLQGHGRRRWPAGCFGDAGGVVTVPWHRPRRKRGPGQHA